MRFSIPLTALFCASTVTALPLTTSSDIKVRSAIPEFRVIGRTFEAVSDEDCDCENENPISGIVDTFLAGGDIGAGIHTILGDANFGQHVIDLSTNAEFLVKFNKLCGSAEFITQLDLLFSNDAFLDTCTGLVADGNFGLQLGVLFTNVEFVKRFSAGISSDAFIGLFGAHFGAGFDFGAKFSGYFSSGAFVKFFISLCGKGAIGGKLGLLFGDSIFLEKFGALLNLKAGFAAGLGGLLADVGFMTHICGTLGLGVDLTAKFVALFGAKASFAAQLELILGASFNGKFGGLFGAGSCTDLLVGFFGNLSFNQICGGGFSGGAFFKAWAGLILNGDFAVKFCGFLGAYISAKVGFALWIGQIFADKVFCVALLGLFGIKSVLSIGLCAILGGVGLVGIVANFVISTLGTILSGTLGIFGKLFGGAKGGYGY
ncbi:hypothetical protein F5X68DRAFT_190108 [Plectosphaerella plurivora]|uniref:Uncharacterized protein n=1 Tax=Plectosphaerella plurivora TaxID=936078 RepID=A0A9P9AB65_9PEZI|nr:hypothetical protein F5X68DRAFT_190108 [Plectosphaerella plurivora]